jgi:hypothetical protein
MTLAKSAGTSRPETLPKKALLLTGKRDVRYPSGDVRLQAADKQRKYWRRGSKTPKMLLISAELDLSLFENGLLPNEEAMNTSAPFSKNGCCRVTNIVAIATQKALAMAAAVDFLSEAKLEEIRTKERGMRLVNENAQGELVVSLSSNCDDANTDQRKIQITTKSFHPRRLSAMTALKKTLEMASISTKSVAITDSTKQEHNNNVTPIKNLCTITNSIK